MQCGSRPKRASSRGCQSPSTGRVKKKKGSLCIWHPIISLRDSLCSTDNNSNTHLGPAVCVEMFDLPANPIHPRRDSLFFRGGYDMNTSAAPLSYRLLCVARPPSPRRRKMLPLLVPVLEIVAASGFVARDPVPLLPHVWPSVFSFFPGVEGAEVPHNQRLHQQHREGSYERGPRPSGQPASTQAADHLRTGLHGAGGPSVALRSATGGKSGSRGRTRRRRRSWWRRREGVSVLQRLRRGEASRRRHRATVWWNSVSFPAAEDAPGICTAVSAVHCPWEELKSHFSSFKGIQVMTK